MPVPTSITDLDTVAANNSPPGTESAKGNVDNYLRAGFGFTRELYNAARSSSYTWLGTAGGTVDAITFTPSPAFTAYAAGQTFRFTSAGANTGAATININSLGAKSITKNGATALSAGDIPSGAVCEVVYDGTQFQLVNAGLIGLGGSAANARSTLGVGIAPRVSGLRGNVNATTPLTQFDLSTDMVTLRDSNGATVTRYNTGTLTCDLGLAGPAANGRDQASAFTASSWINLFFIWNGTTLATIASTASHTTGPTLPSGYTHWCYATTIRWNASSNIIPAFAKGPRIFYDNGENRVLNVGTATALTAISCAGFIPPNAATGYFQFQLVAVHSSTAGFRASIRPTGSTAAALIVCRVTVQVANQTADQSNWTEYPVGNSQQIDYAINAAPSSGGFYIDVMGYTVPNGGD